MDIHQITETNTRRALESVRRAAPLRGNPLLEMSALRSRLRARGASITEASLELVLFGLIHDIVEARRTTMRRAAVPPAAAVDAGGADAERRDLASDLNSAAPDLEAWGCLHARYLAVHALQVQEIAAIARPGSPHGRKHVARRVGRGIALLVHELREEELRAQSAAATAAGPSDASVTPTNLPLERSSFVGRDRAVADVGGLLAHTSLLTLVGPGGVGKTRLALQAARSQLDRFPDGVWFVALDRVAVPERVAESVAVAVDVVERHGDGVVESIRRHLAGRRTLLVLDNCEHLMAACASLADDLLGECPGLRILATSREALRVEGEHVVAVPPLEVPAAGAPHVMDGQCESAAVQLFVERARSSHLSFMADAEEEARIAELCRRLDGLPLAIELAAARVGTLPVREILARIEDRFRLLTTGRRTATERQRTLYGTVAWSYDLLSESGRALLRALSVFRGGWTLPAATAVGHDDAAAMLERIAELADKSLVVPADDDDEARFGMLETIRHFAADRLVEEDADGVRLRHQAYYLALAEEAAEALGGPEQAAWLRRLARDDDNLVAAIATGQLGAAAAQAALRLAAALARAWQQRGRLSDGRLLLAQALGLPGNDQPTPARARALHGAGDLAYQQGDYASARDLLQEGLAIDRAAGNQPGIAAALRSLGKIADAVGDFQGARRHYEDALAMYASIGDAWGEAASLNNLGLLALREGQAEAARAQLERSLERFQREGDAWASGVTLSNLADVALARNDLDAAQDLFRESLAIATDVGDRDGEAYAHTSLGSIASQRGEPDMARECLRLGLDALLETESLAGIAEWLEAGGGLATAQGEPGAAVTLLGAAGALRARIDAPLPPKDAAAHERALATLREALDDASFERFWNAGRRMSWMRAVELARSLIAATD